MSGRPYLVADLDLPDSVSSFLSKQWGIKSLYPPQAEAIPAALGGRNLLLAIPTASGKSLVAYLAICRRLLVEEIGSRAIYIVPLKALASEKYEELQSMAAACGLEVGMAVGDASREVQNLEKADIIVCTSEKLDSLSRNRPDVISGVSIVVADEIHLVNDSSRGPTLEVNLARLRISHPKAQIVALSATIGNPDKIAEWLDAELIISEWRPVPLQYATLAERHLEIRSCVSASEVINLPVPRILEGPKSHIAWCALKDTIDNEGQLLVFVSTRRSAESEARKLAERTLKILQSNSERMSSLSRLADEIQKENDSALSDRLASAVRGGLGFHHAGLTYKQRKSIEKAFKDGLLYCLTATPTLAAGVNLPARRVLIRDLKRWQDGMTNWISTIEIRQMMGRAGRPRYDTQGEAWLACKGEDPVFEADAIAERYIHGPPEPVISKLAAEPPLRMHLLSGIATGGLDNRDLIRRFFKATFLSKTQPAYLIDERIDKTLNWLVEEGFINRGVPDKLIDEADSELEDWDDELPSWAISAGETAGVVDRSKRPINDVKSRIISTSIGFERADNIEVQVLNSNNEREPPSMTYQATNLGKRVAQLYLDPLSATILRNGFRKAIAMIAQSKKPTEFAIMHLISSTPDFLMMWAKRSKDELHVKTAIESEGLLREEILEDVLLGLTQTAWTLERWIDEAGFRTIESEMKVAPGDLRTRVELMRWLLYAGRELVLNDEDISEENLPNAASLGNILDSLKQRITHGCKTELLPMVRIPNIGRGRARDLFSLGLMNPRDVLELTDFDKRRLMAIRGWGPKVLERAARDIRKMS